MLEKVSQKRTFIFQEAVFCYLYLMLTSERTFAFFPEEQCCWVFQKEKKINQREKTQTQPHRFAHGLLVSLWQSKATFTVLENYRILSLLDEKCCYHSALVIFGF